MIYFLLNLNPYVWLVADIWDCKNECVLYVFDVIHILYIDKDFLIWFYIPISALSFYTSLRCFKYLYWISPYICSPQSLFANRSFSSGFPFAVSLELFHASFDIHGLPIWIWILAYTDNFRYLSIGCIFIGYIRLSIVNRSYIFLNIILS